VTTVSVEEAQTRLAQLIAQMRPDETVWITRDDVPVAYLTPVSPPPRPQFGRCRGLVQIQQDDDSHLEDFADYMP
jgi:antitoxin (DNA-binding transcriptional repressor) of toxin-antitoxin stability system